MVEPSGWRAGIRRVSLVVMFLLVAGGLAGCGRGPEGLVTCFRGGDRETTFDAALLDGPEVTLDTPAGVAMAAFFTTGGGAIESALFHAADSFVMIRDEPEEQVLVGKVHGKAQSWYRLRLQDSTWDVISYGGCSLRVSDYEIYTIDWSLRSVSDDERQLGITALGGMCVGQENTRIKVKRVETVETAEAVTITVWADSEPFVEMCPGVADGIPLTIDLDEPLGDRRLLNGAFVEPRPAPDETDLYESD